MDLADRRQLPARDQLPDHCQLPERCQLLGRGQAAGVGALRLRRMGLSAGPPPALGGRSVQPAGIGFLEAAVRAELFRVNTESWFRHDLENFSLSFRFSSWHRATSTGPDVISNNVYIH